MGAPRVVMTSGGFGVIPHDLEQILRTSAAELFTAKGVDVWMNSRWWLLNDEIPRELAKSKTGFLRAEALLNALKNGEVL